MKEKKGLLISAVAACILIISMICGSVFAEEDLFSERTLFIDDFKCIKNTDSEMADIKFNIISSYQTSAEVLLCFENNDILEEVYRDTLEINYKAVYSKKVDVKGYSSVKVILLDSISGLKPISYKREFKIEDIESGRETVLLNGVWDFMPAENSAKDLPVNISDASWGTILVPGVWENTDWFNDNYSVRSVGIGDMWNGSQIGYDKWKNVLKNVSRSWFKKSVEIPSYWEGKKTVITVEDVSTDAVIYVNGNYCGEFNWEDKDRDIEIPEEYINYGAENTVIIKVIAADSIEQFAQFNNPKNSIITHSTVQNKGIMGDVSLTNIKSDLISGTYIKTSVTGKMIDIDVMLNEHLTGATVTAEIFDMTGEKVKVFSNTLNSSNKKITIKSNWDDPVLWDTDNPYMYSAHIIVECNGRIDDYTDKFGFREFEIRGKDFYLNNKKIRLRPVTAQNSYANVEAAYNEIDGLKKANFNIVEIWPSDKLNRGVYNNRKIYAKVADELGMLLIYPISTFNSFIDSSGNVDWAEYSKQVEYEWMQICNRPSIVSFITQPNYFGTGDDENPYKLGNRARLIEDIRKTGGESKVQLANNLINTIKKYEKTRPITTHHGSAAGDWHTSNFYLNLIPLQERKEWFIEWLKNGDIPFTAIEFGMPFEDTFTRQRQAGGRGDSEPLYTEYAASYIGARAYELEKTQRGIEYNDDIRNRYVGGMSFNNLQKDKLFNNPAIQELISLYTKETWKSYRAQDIGGGFMPWSMGGGLVAYTGMYRLPQFAEIDNPYPYYEGQHGIYNFKVSKGLQLGTINDPTAWRPVMSQLKDSNAPFAAYIMGNTENISEVSHNFYEGANVQKQMVVINDTRHQRDYTADIDVAVGGEKVYSGSVSGSIAPGENDYKTINFNLPEVSAKTSGSIKIVVNSEGEQFTDEFEITVFDRIPSQNNTVYMFDPLQETKAFYQNIGYTVENYSPGQELKGQTVIIGKNALESNSVILDYINGLLDNGCKIIVHGQNKEWMESSSDFRIANVVSRQVFKVASQNNHKILSGLDDKDLANWNGRGSIAPEEINTEISNTNWPRDGYHWKNTGSVTSLPIEKPHFSGFTPILECEYDLAYSPLMELDKENGKVIICMLDIESRGEEEPAADLIVKNMVDYCLGAEAAPRKDTILIGGTSADRALLGEMGLLYKAGSVSAGYTDKLIIFGRNYAPSASDIDTLKASNKLLFLANGYNVERNYASNFTGSINIPATAEMKGVSASDAHIRVGINTQLFAGSNALLDGMAAVDGNITMIAVLPDAFNTNAYFYYRTSKWRNQRFLSQIISNLGGSFENDAEIFNESVSVDLNPYYNMDGIATAENPKNGNFDNYGYSYAAELIPDTIINDNIEFAVGSKANGANNMVIPMGQQISINANVGRLSILAAGTLQQTSGNFTVKYTDGTTQTTSVNVSGWGHYNADEVALEMPYRYTPWTASIQNFYVRMYRYDINVNPDKQVEMVSLPSNSNMRIISMSYKGKVNNCYSSDYITEHENGDDPYRYHRW